MILDMGDGTFSNVTDSANCFGNQNSLVYRNHYDEARTRKTIRKKDIYIDHLTM